MKIQRPSAAIWGLSILLGPGVGYAQQPPAGRGGPPPVKVLIAGENPALRLLDKEGGKALTEVNFWRAQWSPVGPGAVCFVTIRDAGLDSLRIAIADNEMLADYLASKLMGSFISSTRFNTPPYKILRGTVTQTNIGTSQRTETCTSSEYKVEITWKDLGEPIWVPEFRPGNGKVVQSFVMVQAKGGEVLVNGKKAPGTYYPTGGGFGPGAFLTLNEAWRDESAK
ncbi:MAG: hypothetical protein JO323_15050 [Acidobacteriia bacterium]|nr:hypothetical protein [Terriglobia bacterium]